MTECNTEHWQEFSGVFVLNGPDSFYWLMSLQFDGRDTPGQLHVKRLGDGILIAISSNLHGGSSSLDRPQSVWVWLLSFHAIFPEKRDHGVGNHSQTIKQLVALGNNFTKWSWEIWKETTKRLLPTLRNWLLWSNVPNSHSQQLGYYKRYIFLLCILQTLHSVS